jgi:hypothetical protein
MRPSIYGYTAIECNKNALECRTLTADCMTPGIMYSMVVTI